MPFRAPPPLSSLLQTLEEPGADDTTKFDLMAPTVVRSPDLGGQGRVELGIIKQFLFSSEMQVILPSLWVWLYMVVHAARQG